MSPYINNLPHLSAEVFAVCMLQHAPDETHRQFVFVRGVGARDDEDIVITYERRKKKPTLEFVVASVGASTSVTESV